MSAAGEDPPRDRAAGRDELTPEEGEALFRKGIEEFNRGAFYEAHDLLEEVWMEERGGGRRFTQGLIQIAVACYHLVERRNFRGARRLWTEGSEKLRPFRPSHRGIDVDALLREAEGSLLELARVERGEKESFDPSMLPRIRPA
jgi:predicted metal-dependent hydrolase